MGFPAYVDLEFSARCNLQCGFCFGPADDRNTKDLPPEFWIEVIRQIASRGARGVVISGGEPTIYPHLIEMLAECRNCGLSVVISTHGRHRERVLQCATLVDWIALPVDAYTSSVLRNLRGDVWGIECAEELAAAILDRSPTTKLKLGTVATKQNLPEIEKLGAHLVRHGTRFSTWKIYQYTPRRKFRNQRSEYEISTDDFRQLGQRLADLGTDRTVHLVLSGHEERRQAYLFVYPEGTVAVPNVGVDFDDLVLGNLDRDGWQVFDRVEGSALFNNAPNYSSTYGQGRL